MGKVIDVDKLNAFILENQRDEGVTQPPVTYTCQTCGAVFQTQSELNSHIASVHPTPPPPVYTCSKCGATFSSQGALDAHTSSVHPPQGQYTNIITKAYRMDKPIMNQDGTGAGFGYGYYQGKSPGSVSCPTGRVTYFYIDTSWRASFRNTVRWINFNVTGPSQHTVLIKLDDSDNGVTLASKFSKQDWVSLPAPGRYLIGVDCTESISLTIYWN